MCPSSLNYCRFTRAPTHVEPRRHHVRSRGERWSNLNPRRLTNRTGSSASSGQGQLHARSRALICHAPPFGYPPHGPAKLVAKRTSSRPHSQDRLRAGPAQPTPMLGDHLTRIMRYLEVRRAGLRLVFDHRGAVKRFAKQVR